MQSGFGACQPMSSLPYIPLPSFYTGCPTSRAAMFLQPRLHWRFVLFARCFFWLRIGPPLGRVSVCHTLGFPQLPYTLFPNEFPDTEASRFRPATSLSSASPQLAWLVCGSRGAFNQTRAGCLLTCCLASVLHFSLEGSSSRAASQCWNLWT